MSVRSLSILTAALAAAGAFLCLLAFMLWVVLGQITDYQEYDLAAAGALEAWIIGLVVVGLAMIGGATLMLVRRSHRADR